MFAKVTSYPHNNCGVVSRAPYRLTPQLRFVLDVVEQGSRTSVFNHQSVIENSGKPIQHEGGTISMVCPIHERIYSANLDA